MNSSELLRIKLANGLYCASNQISIGPTGSTGPAGPSAGPISSGVMKGFTIYANYLNSNSIISVYIPPGLFPDEPLASGGNFTSNVGTSLVFYGLSSITLSGTTYRIVCGILASGFTVSRQWSPAPYGNIQAGRIYYTVPSFNTVSLTGLNLTNINGGNIAITPGPSDPLFGYLATITIFYI